MNHLSRTSMRVSLIAALALIAWLVGRETRKPEPSPATFHQAPARAAVVTPPALPTPTTAPVIAATFPRSPDEWQGMLVSTVDRQYCEASSYCGSRWPVSRIAVRCVHRGCAVCRWRGLRARSLCPRRKRGLPIAYRLCRRGRRRAVRAQRLDRRRAPRQRRDDRVLSARLRGIVQDETAPDPRPGRAQRDATAQTPCHRRCRRRSADAARTRATE